MAVDDHRTGRFFALFAVAGRCWSDDQCYRLGASLAYYTVFSIFPLLLLCVTAAGFVLGGNSSARERLLDYVGRSGAPQARALVEQTLASMQAHETARGVSTVVGILTLVIGASAVFSELSTSLNLIWRVRTAERQSTLQAVFAAVRDKVLSFLVVIATAVALLALLVLSSALSAVDSSASKIVHSPTVWLALEAVVSVFLLTGLLSAVYRMLPRTYVAWRDVFGGALVAALLFTGLKRLLSWYFGHIGNYAAYGAVGGVLGLMAWIYLASLILFYGAEFTHAYAERYGSLTGAPLSEPLKDERHGVSERAPEPDTGPKPHSFA